MIREFLQQNAPHEFTAKEISDALKPTDFQNYYTESQVSFELKEGIEDVKFIHSREVCDFNTPFIYEAFKFAPGFNSQNLNFH